jgi:hypothetical protein
MQFDLVRNVRSFTPVSVYIMMKCLSGSKQIRLILIRNASENLAN